MKVKSGIYTLIQSNNSSKIEVWIVLVVHSEHVDLISCDIKPYWLGALYIVIGNVCNAVTFNDSKVKSKHISWIKAVMNLVFYSEHAQIIRCEI